MPTLADVQKEALGLPEDDRLELARQLIESCDPQPSEEAERAWEEEIEKRMDEVESGTAEGRPAGDILAEIDRKYRWES